MVQFTSDGTAFESFGNPNSPTIILIHGLGLNRAVWQWQQPELAKDYHVVCYDLYGHGGSSLPPSEPSLTLFSSQLLGLMDHCEIKAATLFGFSLGGMIARKVAQEAPERTSALAILNSPHQRTEAAQRAILERVNQARTEGSSATIEAALERWFTDRYRLDNPAMLDLVRSWVLANDLAIYHRNYRVLADGIDEITAPQPPINCPTLVMTGTEDYGNGPEMTLAIAAEIPGADVHILKGLRHMALAENPDAVTLPLLNFLHQTHKEYRHV